MSQIFGKVHSIETCGTVDGPGIRFVLFMQGCPLRCQYCHNPDTWKMSDGKDYSAQEMFQELIKYKSYMQFSKGGVTVTGGEPLLQATYLISLFELCKENGIHTAIDTSGYILNESVKKLLSMTDLVILDIKNFDPLRYQEVTGVELEPTIRFLDYLQSIEKSTWIRYVLVPGLTDEVKSITALAKHLSTFNNIEKIEVLPFHKMGEYKWKELDIPYKLTDTNEPSEIDLLEVVNIFRSFNPDVLIP